MSSENNPDSHPHDHTAELRNASKQGLIGALVLTTGYMLAAVIGGILAGSLALIANAAYILTGAASIALALVAKQSATKAASAERTFGIHRIEILAALANALTLWLITTWIVVEAFQRLQEVPAVQGMLMLSVGAVGLIVNILALWIVRRSSGQSLGVEDTVDYVLSDLLGSVGVVISGTLISAFGWTAADPMVSVVIAVLILLSTWRLLARVVNVLLEGVPEHIDTYRLCSEMEEVEGVILIHDIHVWTIAQGYDALNAHVLVDPSLEAAELDPLLRRLRKVASQDFGIQHITIQMEQSVEGCTEHHHVDHLHHRERPEPEEEP
ncbi:MAG: cation transporter [Acidobacteria bacterium]|nr:cation transporter [Acidobacteriota bacterium]